LADEAYLSQVAETLVEADVNVIAPLREEARKAMEDILQPLSADRIHLVGSLPYLEFGWLTAHALAIVTDSGNVAEEATFNGVPCMTLNDYTEHQETVTVGSNVLIGGDIQKLRTSLCSLKEGRWKQCALPDRWDGRTAERILQVLLGPNS